MSQLPMDPQLAHPVLDPTDPDTGEPLDCTRCGACCEAGPGSALISMQEIDRWRALGRHDLADNTREGHFGLRAFPTDASGACTYLRRENGQTLCTIYELRGDTCRSFQAGTWQCIEFRRDARRRAALPEEPSGVAR